MPTFIPKDLARWCEGRWLGKPETAITGVSHDSRTLNPGDLYIAIRGDRFDGHAFVETAFASGASAAMVHEQFVPQCRRDLPYLVVPDTRRALLSIAEGYRAGLDLCVIGVSGSVGKTTVKELVADMLSYSGSTIRNSGNWNNDIGLPLSLLRIEPGHRHGVFEVGINHPGEMDRLSDCLKADAAIMTEIGPVHAEHFASEQEIAREKAILFASLVASGPAVASRDKPWFEVLEAAAQDRMICTSLGGEADFVGSVVPDQPGIFHVLEVATKEQCQIEMPLPGTYFQEDALLAIAMGRTQGVAWNAVQEAVRSFQPQPMRWNVQHHNARTVIDDSYNANPVSMTAALKAFADTRGFTGKWLVLGGMLELGDSTRAFHYQLGKEVSQGSWKGLVAFGDQGVHIANGARAEGMPASNIHWCERHAEVVEILSALTRPGDAILIKASRGERMDAVLELWAQQMDTEQTGA